MAPRRSASLIKKSRHNQLGKSREPHAL